MFALVKLAVRAEPNMVRVPAHLLFFSGGSAVPHMQAEISPNQS
jgi:hypothetical protein